MKRTFRWIILYLTFLLSSGFPLINSEAATVETLSFTTKKQGHSDLYLIDSTGQNLRRLKTNNMNKHAHAWSPDGRFFAYQSNDEGSPNIYVMDVRSKVSRQLTAPHGRNLWPAWSPNGKWIAFVSDRTGTMDIYRINVNGSNLRRLTSKGDNGRPAWSPDSQWIVFDSYRGGNHKAGIPGRHFLYKMTAEGGRSKQLRGIPNLSGCTWSPDGKQIAFAAGNPGDQGINIYVIDADGGNLQRLTHVGRNGWASHPVWSPDGQWIAYAFKKKVKDLLPGVRVPIAEVFGDSAIYLLKVTGRALESIEIANGFSIGLEPAWVPEGFLSVSPSGEKQNTLWGRLKQTNQ